MRERASVHRIHGTVCLSTNHTAGPVFADAGSCTQRLAHHSGSNRAVKCLKNGV
jgi:hypothetical protein